MRHDFGIVFRRWLIAAIQAQSVEQQRTAQRFEFLWRWAFVYAVQAWAFALCDELGCADVGGEHTFFDQAVCVVARAWQDFLYFAVFVRHDVGFGGFKFHRTALLACLKLDFEQRVQIFDVRCNGFVLLGQYAGAFG